jgi:hypothetical protein
MMHCRNGRRHIARLAAAVIALSLALAAGACGRIGYDPLSDASLSDDAANLPSRLGVTSRIDGWYLHGGNLPWRVYGADFGDDTSGAASAGAQAELEPAFQAAQDGGLHLVRWVMFPTQAIPLTRDAGGVVNGFQPGVARDLDAAMDLAMRHDLYLMMVVLSGDGFTAVAGMDDASRNGAAQAIGALAQHAQARSNRVLSWGIWPAQTLAAVPGFNALDVAIARAVRASSSARYEVEVNTFDEARRACWNGADFAGFNEVLAANGDCAHCTDYATIVRDHDPRCPIIVDLFFANASSMPLATMQSYYARGYAGALTWSLLPQRTNDQVATDFTATLTFSQSAADIGPR